MNVTPEMLEAGRARLAELTNLLLTVGELEAIYLAMKAAEPEPKEKRILSSTEVERVIAAMKSHEVVGVAFPDSCCTVYRVQITGTPTVIGGDHADAGSAQAICDELNARAALASMGDDGLREALACRLSKVIRSEPGRAEVVVRFKNLADAGRFSDTLDAALARTSLEQPNGGGL